MIQRREEPVLGPIIKNSRMQIRGGCDRMIQPLNLEDALPVIRAGLQRQQLLVIVQETARSFTIPFMFSML